MSQTTAFFLGCTVGTSLATMLFLGMDMWRRK